MYGSRRRQQAGWPALSLRVWGGEDFDLEFSGALPSVFLRVGLFFPSRSIHGRVPDSAGSRGLCAELAMRMLKGVWKARQKPDPYNSKGRAPGKAKRLSGRRAFS